MPAAPSELAVCGGTVYHRVDDEATRLWHRAIRVLVRSGYLVRDGDRWAFTDAAENWSRDGRGRDDSGVYWLWHHVSRRYANAHPKRWWYMPYPHEFPAHAKLTVCGYLRGGIAKTVAAIEAENPTLRACKSRHCWPEPKPDRIDAASGRRAYLHTLDCETCQHEGTSRCEIIGRLASGELESDVDPRLDPDA